MRTARTGRCAGEGELVLGLTEHGGTLTNASGGVNWQLWPGSGVGLVAVSERTGTEVRKPETLQMVVDEAERTPRQGVPTWIRVRGVCAG